jgi:hypothetical protein
MPGNTPRPLRRMGQCRDPDAEVSTVGVVRSHWSAGIRIRRRARQRPLGTASTVWAWLGDVPLYRHGLIVLRRLFLRVDCRLAGLPGRLFLLGSLASLGCSAGRLVGNPASLGYSMGRLLGSPASLGCSMGICSVGESIGLAGHPRVTFWTFPSRCLAGGPPGSWAVFGRSSSLLWVPCSQLPNSSPRAFV